MINSVGLVEKEQKKDTRSQSNWILRDGYI